MICSFLTMHLVVCFINWPYAPADGVDKHFPAGLACNVMMGIINVVVLPFKEEKGQFKRSGLRVLP